MLNKLNNKQQLINDDYFCEELNKICPKFGCGFPNSNIVASDKPNDNNFFKYLRSILSKNKIEKDISEFNEPKMLDHDAFYQLIELANQNDKSFFISFLKYFPDFSKKLMQINPTFKSHEIEFCAYLRLNIQTKEIASIRKMSIRAVESKKYRIRKKLKLNSKDCLYNVINHL